MKALPYRSTAVVLSSALLAVIGCGDTVEPVEKTSTEMRGHDHQEGHNHGEHDHGAATGNAMDQMKAVLAELPAADAAAAEAQHFCPVSDEMLGTMGPPERVMVDGREVWICCDGCRERLLADPAPYLAKLDKK